MEDKKKYYKGLGARLDEEELLDKKSRSFSEGLAKLKASTPDVMDRTLSESENLKTMKPGAWQAKIDALRAARKASKGVVEKAGDVLDYRQLRKAAMKGLKSVPLIGTAASLLTAEDAAAALPVLDSAESAGMSAQDEDMMMSEIQGRKEYEKSQARRDAILRKLKNMR